VNGGVADPERAAPNIWDTTPENQAASNQDKVWPVRVICRGDAVRPLPPHARSLADLTFEVGDVRLSPSDYIARRRTAGLLILKHGWPTGPAARLARSRRPARQRSHRLRSAGAGRPRGIRLPLVGGSSPAGRRE
jgi:hypothetical protein